MADGPDFDANDGNKAGGPEWDESPSSNRRERREDGKGGADRKQDERFQPERGTGLVKSVVSGDTITLLQIDAQGKNPPKERRITLSNLDVPELAQPKRVQIMQAQRLAEKEGETFDESKFEVKTDEPFAFASREHLRRLVAGCQVTFVVEAKLGKEYGFVYLPTGRPDDVPTDVSLALIEAGFATVRESAREDPRPGMEAYLDAEDAAIEEGRGMHTKDKNLRRKAIRKVWQDSDLDTSTFFEKHQNKEIDAVVEVIRSGSNLRVSLASGEELNVFLSGVEAPERGQPFEKEAKFFAEATVLHRDVKIVLEGADRTSFYGSVFIDGLNLAEQLLKSGLVRFVDWSAQRTRFAKQLRAAETAAKQGRIRVFRDGAKSAEKPTPKGVKREIIGRVSEVISVGAISVTDNGGNTSKVFLSSIRPPRAGRPQRRGQSDNQDAEGLDGESNSDPESAEDKSKAQMEAQVARDGKEYLRAQIIGKRVRCVLDYVQELSAKGKQEAETRGKYSVYSLDSKENVAVAAVAKGYAYAFSHRGTEDRSKEYGDLMSAEADAKRAKSGLWTDPKSVVIRNTRDLTQADLTEAKQHFPFLKRAGRTRGVVEYEFSPSKLKVYIPKEDTTIAISLTGVRTPLMRLPNKDKNPMALEALKRVRDLAHQRDVEFEILAQDRTGGFIGNVYLAKDKVPLAVHLLESGHASIHRPSLDEVPNERDFEIAEEGAKRQKIGVWEGWDPEVEEAKRKARRAEREETNKPKQDLRDVVVTEIVDGRRFFVQMVSKEAEQLETLMAELQEACQGDAPADYKPKRREVVAGQFTADNSWYRARVESLEDDGRVVVQYVDYGNHEELEASRVRPLDDKFKSLPHQAVAAQLAYIKVPSVDEDFGREAAEFLAENTQDKTLMANVEYRQDDTLFLSLGDRDSQEHIGAALLRAGLAQVERSRGNRWDTPIKAKLREEEDKARRARVGIFQYGDPGDSDDEL